MRRCLVMLLTCFALARAVTAADLGDELCPAAAATHKSVVFQGSWNDASTWSPAQVPPVGSRVLIQCNTIVTIHQDTADIQWVRVDGTLMPCDHCDTKLSVHTIYVPMMGRARWGMPDMPCSGKSVIEFVPGAAVGLTGPFLPGDWQKLSLGLLCHGEFMACGSEKGAWYETDVEMASGDSQITLKALPYNWNVGDDILIAGTDAIGTPNPYDRVANRYQSEFRKITAIDQRTVTLDQPLKYRHYLWRADLPFHVANLTRNVVICSRDTSAIENRGHLMFMTSMNDIRYTKIEGLGRTDKSKPATDPRKDANGVLIPGSDANPRARYADHNHRTGPLNPPSRRMWNVVDGSPGWGMVNHASNCQWDNCICIRCYGAGFSTEEGQECGWMRRCLAAFNRGLMDTTREGADGRPEVGDFGVAGEGFWMQGPLVEVSDCVAFDNSGRGFNIFNKPLNDYPNYNGDPKFPGYLRFPIVADPSLLPAVYPRQAITTAAVPLRVFARNTSYNNGTGIESWTSFFAVGDGLPPTVWGSMSDVTIWGRGAILIAEYTQQMRIDGLKVIGDGLFRSQDYAISRNGAPLYIRLPNITVTGLDSAGMGRDYIDVGTAGQKATHSVERVQ